MALWGLVATAAAGLQAGVGLAAVLVSHPAGLEAGVEAHKEIFLKAAKRRRSLSNTLSAVWCAAAASAYFSAPEGERDQAWLTCAVVAGVQAYFDYQKGQEEELFSTVHSGKLSQQQREEASTMRCARCMLRDPQGWLQQWGRQQWLPMAASGAAFLSMLLLASGKKLPFFK